jgi:hypothetical protein
MSDGFELVLILYTICQNRIKYVQEHIFKKIMFPLYELHPGTFGGGYGKGFETP